MANRAFNAEIQHQPGLAIITLTGEIDAFAEAGLNEAYIQAETGNSGAILFDFSAVKYINSTGIALIVGLLARARKDHRPLVAFGLSPHYQELFQITRLSNFIIISPDQASALAQAGA